MSVTAILGGQFGSEGKGKIAAHLAFEFDVAVRTGGPNAGHTVEYNGQVFKMQSIPCAFINKDAQLVIGAGGMIDPEILFREIDMCGISRERLIIDPQAGIIDESILAKGEARKGYLGSTGKGVGPAVAAKALRDPNFKLARDRSDLSPYLGDTAAYINHALDQGKHVCLEGTQGFGLSNIHGGYPFVTNRDTTVAALCSEAGVSPRFVSEVILVIRTYPIRVAGNSGGLVGEIDWEKITQMSGSPTPITEITTVTKKVRRVGQFDLEMVKRAVLLNRPTQIALLFADYLSYDNYGKQQFSELTSDTQAYINSLEEQLGVPITFVGTGPGEHDLIDMRAEKLR